MFSEETPHRWWVLPKTSRIQDEKALGCSGICGRRFESEATLEDSLGSSGLREQIEARGYRRC